MTGLTEARQHTIGILILHHLLELILAILLALAVSRCGLITGLWEKLLLFFLGGIIQYNCDM